MEQDDIIKALECLLSTDYDGREFCARKGCSYAECENCLDDALRDALSLIKELTEENDRLRAELEQRPPKLVITKLPKKERKNV